MSARRSNSAAPLPSPTIRSGNGGNAESAILTAGQLSPHAIASANGISRNARAGAMGNAQPVHRASEASRSDRRRRPVLHPRAGDALGEALALAAFGVEIPRVEPVLETVPHCRPLAIEHRIPRRVAAARFVDHRLPENAFELESITQRGGSRRRVQRIALPFVAAIPELVERAT